MPTTTPAARPQVDQARMRAAARQQALERAAREGVGCRIYQGGEDAAPIWYVRTAAEGEPEGATFFEEMAPTMEALTSIMVPRFGSPRAEVKGTPPRTIFRDSSGIWSLADAEMTAEHFGFLPAESDDGGARRWVHRCLDAHLSWAEGDFTLSVDGDRL